jgi:hypothetical protein
MVEKNGETDSANQEIAETFHKGDKDIQSDG